MKLKTLAKVTIALGVLSASTMATEGQTGHAKEKQEKKQYLFYTNILKNYYTGKSYKVTNINGKSQEFSGSNVLRFNHKNQNFQVSLFGKDENKYKEETYGLDVFVVPELIETDGTIYSIGGVTKKNIKSVFGFVSNPSLQIKKVDSQDGFSVKELLFIQKEEVSLKELDFKIRKLLIEKYGLYEGKSDDGTININMKDGTSHKIDLYDKLEDDRMADVMDSTQIKSVEVNLE
ncbi:TPA: exotoxin beta-grasp domain-containing protein [Staphylococcus aureus]